MMSQQVSSIYRHDADEMIGQLSGASSLRARFHGRIPIASAARADSAVEDDQNREEEFPEDGVEPEEDDEFDDEDSGDGDWEEDEDEDEDEEYEDEDEEYEDEDEDEEYEDEDEEQS